MSLRRRGFTLLELALSVAVVGALLSVLLPALFSARVASRREVCAGNQRVIGTAWRACLEDGGADRFPVVQVQPGWRYGGVRFSSIDGAPFLEFDRPLNRYLSLEHLGFRAERIFACPADTGITDASRAAGTGRRSAYEAFGTSYRANAELLSPSRTGAPEGLALRKVTTAPSRLVVMGDAGWHETLESSGIEACWHGAAGRYNLLFLDGSVRFVPVLARPRVGPAVFDPCAPELLFPLRPEWSRPEAAE